MQPEGTAWPAPRGPNSYIALIIAAVALAGTITLAFVMRDQHHQTRQLQQQTQRARAQHHQTQQQLHQLQAVLCVTAHTNDRGDQIVAGLYQAGQFDAADYRPDYPEC